MTWIAASLAGVLMSSGQAAGQAPSVCTAWEGRLFVGDGEEPAAASAAPKEEMRKVRVIAREPIARRPPGGFAAIEFIGNNPRMVSTLSVQPRSMEAVVESRIDTIKKVCNLSPQQVRKLMLAGKGAAHRIRAKSRRTFQIDGREFTLEIPMNPEEFETQPIWLKTVETTLTAEQKKKWDAHQKKVRLHNERVMREWFGELEKLQE